MANGARMDDAKQACSRLREERTRLGMSQQRFAEAGAVSRKTQGAYESGASSPTVAYLNLVSALGVDVQYVVSGVREGGPAAGHAAIEVLPGFGAAGAPAQIQLPELVLRRKVGVATRVADLRWALNPSRAMSPAIERHQLVLVDVAQRSLGNVIAGTAYAYALWGHRDIRRIFRQRDRWSIVGLADEAQPTELYVGEGDSLEIFGAVVGVI